VSQRLVHVKSIFELLISKKRRCEEDNTKIFVCSVKKKDHAIHFISFLGAVIVACSGSNDISWCGV